MTMEGIPGTSATQTLKYKIDHSEKFGRYLKAAKNLQAGEVIFRENATVVGPMISSNNCMCFACLRLLPEPQYICSKCNIAPLCGPICEEASKHHTAHECETFKNNSNLSAKNIEEIIGILLPLRLLLLKEIDSQVWKQVESMESHMDKRRNTPVWKDRETNVINVMKALHFVPEDDPSISELLQKLCGIIDVNSFELRTPGGLDGVLLRGLYMEASLMAHDCRGNTHLAVDDKFQLIVYASLPIKEDESILFNYTSPLLGTLGRREHLRYGKYFECECSLCSDRYEMGTFMSCIICPRCRTGCLGLKNPLTNLPYEKDTRWICNKCNGFIGGRLTKTTLTISKTLLDEVNDNSIEDMETLVTRLSKSLPPNNFLMLTLKQKLMAAYRKVVTGSNPPMDITQRLLNACRELYDVLEIVEPGISRLKGIMLYEMHLPLVLIANDEYSKRVITLAQLLLRLEEAKRVLKKSLTMLFLEPVETPEGQLARRAMVELKTLNQNIADVSSFREITERAKLPSNNTMKLLKNKSHKNK